MSQLDPTAAEAAALLSGSQDWSVDDIAEPEAAEHTAAAAAGPVVAVARRPVSGRYLGSSGSFRLELRVDVDRVRPTKRLSGDFYQVSGATVTYFGSFRVDSPTITASPQQVTIEGNGQFTFVTLTPRVRVTIPRVSILTPPASATVRFSSPGAAGTQYVCPFVSPHFRTVQFEQDLVAGTTLFSSYDTGSLPSGGPARTLTVSKAFAEAGIELASTSATNTVPTAGVGPTWSNAELHAAMETQFSLWKDLPQWAVWLLVANRHDMGLNLRGIMFDQQGKQRQGCAVFWDAIGGATADSVRAQLRTYVHELGHCFNLLHSWQKSLAQPPATDRPDSLSYMNYPANYPGGAPAYWAAFPFQFDDQEVIHLRHAFRNHVIMGGNNFAIGAAEWNPNLFADPLEDNSGLELRLEARQSFRPSEPVVVDIRLSAADLRGRRVWANLHPNFGFVQIGIRKPSGQVVVYEPLIQHCTGDDTVVLDAERPAIYDSAYVGYGKGGFSFDQTGIYQLRAIYSGVDGSRVYSNILAIRVRHPQTTADEEVADLFYGSDQGALLYLLGSDSPYLASGVKAFEQVLDKHAQHPLSLYAKLVQGTNLGREFKRINADKTLAARKPQHQESIAMLSEVAAASERGEGLDNITCNQVMRRLARLQIDAGDDKGGKATAQRILTLFGARKLKNHVLARIQKQVTAEFGITPPARRAGA